MVVVAESESEFRHRFSWSATFAGAVAGVAVIIFLLALGSGVGLSLISSRNDVTPTFLTLGGIYFLAAEAMGFAVAGHLVGRLIGPMAETDREEEFRAAAHGLAVWGLSTTAMAVLTLLLGVGAVGSPFLNDQLRLAPNPPASLPTAAYWTDVLFRPTPLPMHASLGWRRLAQADTSVTDAPSSDDESSAATVTPMTSVPPGSGRTETVPPPTGATEIAAPDQSSAAPHVITIPEDTQTTAAGTPASAATPAAGNADAKAEVTRILEMWTGGTSALPAADRERIIQLISQTGNISAAESSRRVLNMEAQVRRDRARIADKVRRTARNASLWFAFALLFGSVVAVMAAISARWEDDRITFGWRNRAGPSSP